MPKSINATLSTGIPVNVEIGKVQSYQSVSGTEDAESTENEANASSTWRSPSKIMKLSALGLLGIVCVLLLVSRKSSKAEMMGSVNDGWMAGDKVEASYCKTSCTSQCSSYFSVYGPLCCDWSEGNDGTKFCAQSVSKEGKCECGVSSVDSQAPAPSKAKIPHPTHAPAQAPHDDGGFHPFPTMAWMPWDDDNKKGGG